MDHRSDAAGGEPFFRNVMNEGNQVHFVDHGADLQRSAAGNAVTSRGRWEPVSMIQTERPGVIPRSPQVTFHHKQYAMGRVGVPDVRPVRA